MPTLLDTAEFALAKATLTETLQRIEKARKDRLESLRRFRAMNQASLENAKRAVRELPNDIARQDAEIVKLEVSTADDLLREAVGKAGDSAEKPKRAEEPFVLGLPPEALRKVWPEWEDEAGDVVTFKDDMYHWAHWSPSTPIKRIADITWLGIKLRPVGTSRAHVEALAKQAPQPEPPPPKHACPRCNEGMREVVITGEARWLGREPIAVGTRLRAYAIFADGYIAVDDRAYLTLLYRFVRDDIPPRSEWCDGSGVKS